jgi:hypothetical protein
VSVRCRLGLAAKGGRAALPPHRAKPALDQGPSTLLHSPIRPGRHDKWGSRNRQSPGHVPNRLRHRCFRDVAGSRWARAAVWAEAGRRTERVSLPGRTPPASLTSRVFSTPPTMRFGSPTAGVSRAGRVLAAVTHMFTFIR